MRFLSSLAIFLATAQAAVTADELIKALNGFKDVATDLQGDARKVNVDDCEFYDQGKRPLNILVGTIGSAVQQATEFAGKLGGSPNYCGARADDVLKAYGGFADAHHRLFNILSHKTEEVAPRRWETYPEAGDAVVSALTEVKGVGKAIAGFMNDHLPCKNNGLDGDTERLTRSLKMCIRRWKRVCGKDCSQDD